MCITALISTDIKDLFVNNSYYFKRFFYLNRLILFEINSLCLYYFFSVRVPRTACSSILRCVFHVCYTKRIANPSGALWLFSVPSSQYIKICLNILLLLKNICIIHVTNKKLFCFLVRASP
jgi:hypothetical protein